MTFWPAPSEPTAKAPPVTSAPKASVAGPSTWSEEAMAVAPATVSVSWSVASPNAVSVSEMATAPVTDASPATASVPVSVRVSVPALKAMPPAAPKTLRSAPTPAEPTSSWPASSEGPAVTSRPSRPVTVSLLPTLTSPARMAASDTESAPEMCISLRDASHMAWDEAPEPWKVTSKPAASAPTVTVPATVVALPRAAAPDTSSEEADTEPVTARAPPTSWSACTDKVSALKVTRLPGDAPKTVNVSPAPSAPTVTAPPEKEAPPAIVAPPATEAPPLSAAGPTTVAAPATVTSASSVSPATSRRLEPEFHRT
mmetsp:Transcript_7044/g.19170  ORF Transcript_7044/g.19170 Transcript_7044/m.19170 type:complete len:313 (-) Transcript_7044:232-1170(-)